MTAARCCPFCTSPSYAGIFTSDGIPVVVCSRCGAQSPTKHNNMRVTCADDALAAWEDRQEYEELKREIESLREQLQFTEDELAEAQMFNRELQERGEDETIAYAVGVGALCLVWFSDGQAVGH